MTALTDEQIRLVAGAARNRAHLGDMVSVLLTDAADAIEQLMAERDKALDARNTAQERLLDQRDEFLRDSIQDSDAWEHIKAERDQLRAQLAEVIAAGDDCADIARAKSVDHIVERWQNATKDCR